VYGIYWFKVGKTGRNRWVRPCLNGTLVDGASARPRRRRDLLQARNRARQLLLATS